MNISFQKVESVTKKVRVVALVKDAIHSGELKPGEPLVETKIAQQFGVGQGLIREALIELEHQGFVQRIPFSGTQITEFNLEEAGQIFDVRMELEPLAFTLAGQKASPADLAELSELIASIKQSAEESNQRRFFKRAPFFAAIKDRFKIVVLKPVKKQEYQKHKTVIGIDSKSFESALTSVFREDVNVIMIGEMRDGETAQIAVQASLTGHLVLATLHTNDAASAVTRLVDMGVEPFLLASTLRGVLAQRLVRRLCPSCRTPHPSTAADRELLGADTPAQLWHAPGCPECARTGYAGRTGIYELMVTDDALQRLIHTAADEADLRAHARRHGAHSLRDDGLRLLAEGSTSAEELLRVTRD